MTSIHIAREKRSLPQLFTEFTIVRIKCLKLFLISLKLLIEIIVQSIRVNGTINNAVLNPILYSFGL